MYVVVDYHLLGTSVSMMLLEIFWWRKFAKECSELPFHQNSPIANDRSDRIILYLYVGLRYSLVICPCICPYTDREIGLMPQAMILE